ncbi:MAG: AbrB/MazE/SpoVT family DNA-binding domain-containing protein [Candidatus Promineofilum sp.]|jgi:antitoxin MazE|nr:AbrB/MazE/SpoVT family DNA-binding domain-containing protein [Promineifilum sp.]
MLTKVQKWGNSVALRIPKAFVEEMRMTVDTAVEMSIEDGKLVISPVERVEYSLEELLAQITPENLHAEVDWGAPVGQETW